ncbi:RNA polymerase sigma factor [Haliangium ochraceum]|uniref:RNA polymerase, sigma-24 subunit, ECF subfamily n=1 Tax=Haliangium ochraceum (strain DSM 14365 / JCM 11303 / SMP-2) TaxID=502025 RepID=D0LKQ9_HALO1|nr:sigma-70 family RNA polymerase sigma factor [Haliangium ochraceum]ACY16629.1 RNA polymerase, sigma-24 subunit, ECF subfamily [Haliangium ochraceum DSM 14365]
MSSDLELLERWRAGKREAGNELFERHFTSIYRFFQNKVAGDVEELVQATFLACVDSRDKFRGQSSFRTYLFSIARFQLYGHYRRNQRDGDALDFGVTSVMDMGASPRSEVARGRRQQRLLSALCGLPLEQQVLLELHYWEGMGMDELAEVFGVERPTVRTRLFRARQALRDRMVALEDSPVPSDMSVEDFHAWARRVSGAKAERDER